MSDADHHEPPVEGQPPEQGADVPPVRPSGGPYESPGPDAQFPPPLGKDSSTADSRNLAMLAHLLGVFVSVLGPLVIWLMKRDDDPFVADQGKEALNFQLTLLIAYVASTVIYLILVTLTCGFGAFLPVPLVVTVVQFVFGIVGAIEASKGVYYRYPFNIRMVN